MWIYFFQQNEFISKYDKKPKYDAKSCEQIEFHS